MTPAKLAMPLRSYHNERATSVACDRCGYVVVRPGIVFKVYIITLRLLVVCPTTRSIMPSRSWRDTGHKAYCVVQTVCTDT